MKTKTKGVLLMDFFSVAGKHHDYKGENNQDALLYKQNRYYSAMVLADGVSTCAHSKAGATIACEAVADFLLKHGERLFCMNEQSIAESLISQVLYHLSKVAEEQIHDIEEYSSTLACILYDKKKNRMLYLSIGDSLITAAKDDKCYIVTMPSDSRNGCCVTTTLNTAKMAKVGVVDVNKVSSVMICSDGAWHLMYRRNRMLQTIKDTIIKHEYEKLKEMLLEKERFDDCSFISMNLRAFSGRKLA